MVGFPALGAGEDEPVEDLVGAGEVHDNGDVSDVQSRSRRLFGH